MSELLVVEGLEKHFPVTQGLVFQRQVGAVKAVDGVSFTVNTGENGVVRAHAHGWIAGVNGGAALADDDVAGNNVFAVVNFDA